MSKADNFSVHENKLTKHDVFDSAANHINLKHRMASGIINNGSALASEQWTFFTELPSLFYSGPKCKWDICQQMTVACFYSTRQVSSTEWND